MRAAIIILETHVFIRGDKDEPKCGGRKQKYFEGNSVWSNLSQYGVCGDAL